MSHKIYYSLKWAVTSYEQQTLLFFKISSDVIWATNLLFFKISSDFEIKYSPFKISLSLSHLLSVKKKLKWR